MEKFNYEWRIKDSIFTKDKGTVFSCFACGGGSTMGYKLAGFDVIGWKRTFIVPKNDRDMEKKKIWGCFFNECLL